MSVPAAPAGTRTAGRRLWASVVDVYELDEHELALLREAVRTVDLLDALAKVAKAEGVVVSTPQGPRAHPAIVEARQQRITLARLLGALRMPTGDDEAGDRRPQRRTGARGVYGIRGVV